MNVLLLYPPHARRSYLATFSLTEALTGIFLGPALVPRHAVRLVDLRVTPDLDRELGGFVPDVAVLAASPLSQPSLGAVLGQLRERFPRVRTLVVGAAEYGAPHIVERPLDYAHALADAIVPGFYIAGLQRKVPEVLEAWDAGDDLSGVAGLWVQRSAHEWVPTAEEPIELADVGVPDRTLLRRARGRYRLGGIGRMAYLMHIEGCRHRCRYCTMSKSDGVITPRSLGEVMGELELITEPNVFLCDFEPLQAPDASLRLANSIGASGIRKRYYMLTRADSVLNHGHVLERWKDVGLRWVFLGLDGHSAARLSTLGKGSNLAVHEAALARLKEIGLHTAVGFTIAPDFTREDFADVRAAVKRLAPPSFDFTVETPLVGTRFFDDTEHELTTHDWSLFDLNHAVLPTRLPLADFYREMTALHALAWRMSGKGVLAAHPWRDILRNACQGGRAFVTAARAARDHRVPAGVPVAA